MIIIFAMFLILYELNSAEFNDEMRSSKEECRVFRRKKLERIGVKNERVFLQK